MVAAVPDFSWGWSAVSMGYMQASLATENDRAAEDARAKGREAADKALALDPENSEALAHKTLILDSNDWVTRESLLKRSIAAQPLDCGCQHYNYALMLGSVGRISESIEEFRQAIDMLALWADSQFDLADALTAAGNFEESRSHFATAENLTADSEQANWLIVRLAADSGDYADAIKALRSGDLAIRGKAEILAGYEALAAHDPQMKARAAQQLAALPEDKQTGTVALMRRWARTGRRCRWPPRSPRSRLMVHESCGGGACAACSTNLAFPPSPAGSD